jgi:hypothetical protein
MRPTAALRAAARFGPFGGKNDAWRSHPIFKWNVWDMLPGIREGTVAFAAFCA